MIRPRRSLTAVLGCIALTAALVAVTGPLDASAGKPAKSAPQNTLGVQVVRFKKATTRTAMYAAVTAAGGEVLTDLSKTGRLAVRSDSASFVSKLKSNTKVAAVWTDRLIKIRLTDVDGTTGNNTPALGSPGASALFDPWHDATGPFLDQNAPGVWQWDDDANGARGARLDGVDGAGIKVAVLDTGVQGSHKEILPNYDNKNSTNTIPCNLLTRMFGPLGQMDCSSEDTEGHGTWVASRIAGALNGFASNGIAPKATISGYKVLSTTLGGGLTSWIVDGMIRACDADADIINMSLGGYDAPGIDDEDYTMWVDATNYCLGKGTAIIASAGNEHVRMNRATVTVGGTSLTGVGQVANTDEGINTIIPGDTVANNDLRGLLEVPAGVPGAIMVSSTNNTNGEPSSPAVLVHLASRPTVGAVDQLAYYSNYGSRIDIAAPGGARKMGIPRYDVGPEDVLYGGWGELGALTGNGEICQDPSLASMFTFSCFKVNGSSFGWLQGTSMSAPNASGVAALALAGDTGLQEHPAALLAKLQATARTGMANGTGPNDPTDFGPSATAGLCTSGYCHLDYYTPGDGTNPISWPDAYGAGIVNAQGAATP
jgi:subtilisin family serine protease